ncbi:proteasome assembly chaperone 1-like [Scyliorhinus torazame]|uniref:proteasome assembly chaperone 1-like n=1 Tax=Scyliorhinus torazame TaxID=75743 RepID=UPI003B59F8D9
MATFFGEVLPVFSRAVEEEEEDEDEEIRRELEGRREITIQWCTGSRASTESSLDLSFTCSTFLIAVGQNAVGFLNSFVQCSGSWEIIGAVTLWNERVKGTDTVNRQFPTDSSCLLYRLTSNPMILTCHCSCYMADDQLFQWTEKVRFCSCVPSFTVDCVGEDRCFRASIATLRWGQSNGRLLPSSPGWMRHSRNVY